MTKPLYSINPNLNNLELSATLNINKISKELQAKGKKIYKFGLGESPFPVPNSVVSELQKHAHQKSYLPVEGLRELQNAISKYLLKEKKIDYEPSNIIVGPGSKELIFILQLVYNAELILASPSWVSYAPQAILNHQKVTWLECHEADKWKLLPQVLKNYCQKSPNTPKLLILNYPNNPHGYSYSANELKELAKIAKKYQILVLSDEIYGRLHHQGKHVSIAKFYPNGTIISDGLSKWSGAGGWRLGFFAFPKSLAWLKKAMQVVASETFTSVSAPIQYAAITAFNGSSEIDDYLSHSREILALLANHLTKELQQHDPQLANPDGGFYLFPNLNNYSAKFKAKEINSSDELCQRMLTEIGLACLPGSAFGRPKEEYTIRLSYVDFNGSKALQTSQNSKALDLDFLRNYCNNCIEGIERLSNWLQE